MVSKTFGFDVGSTAAKLVVYGNGKITDYTIDESRNWRKMLSSAGAKKNAIYSTGYFRNIVPRAKSVTEITAAIYGVQHYYKGVDIIVDIGGQDTKIIDLRTNRFQLNDKCSAGTGAFIEFIAKYLGVSVTELSELHAKSKKPVKINNTCGVFALSEIISNLAGENKIEDIVAGVHFAFARRIAQQIPDVDTADKIVLIGGAAKNKGMASALSDVLDMKLLVPKEPQIICAIGAAEYYSKLGNPKHRAKKV